MNWFYSLDGRQQGPVAEAQLDALLQGGTIKPDTLVWREGLVNWQPLREARSLVALPSIPAGDAPPIGTACAECQRLLSQDEMVFLNQTWVCQQCKPIFLQRMMEGVAPFGGGGQLWRKDRQLVVRSGSTMPDRCVCCNAPANGYRLKRQLYWHPAAYYLLILLNLLIYIIVALIIRKRALIHVGLCEKHRAGRKQAILGSWLAVLLGVVLMFVGFSTHGAFALIGLVLILTAAVFGSIKGRVVAPTKIEKDIVWVKGAGSEFLEKLPAWSGLR